MLGCATSHVYAYRNSLKLVQKLKKNPFLDTHRTFKMATMTPDLNEFQNLNSPDTNIQVLSI